MLDRWLGNRLLLGSGSLDRLKPRGRVSTSHLFGQSLASTPWFLLSRVNRAGHHLCSQNIRQIDWPLASKSGSSIFTANRCRLLVGVVPLRCRHGTAELLGQLSRVFDLDRLVNNVLNWLSEDPREPELPVHLRCIKFLTDLLFELAKLLLYLWMDVSRLNQRSTS